MVPTHFNTVYFKHTYTLSEAWRGVNWVDLMAAQGAFGTEFYDRSTRTIVGTLLWTEYRPVIKIGPKGALGSHEIRPIHSAPSLAQSIHFLSNRDIIILPMNFGHKMLQIQALHRKTVFLMCCIYKQSLLQNRYTYTLSN